MFQNNNLVSGYLVVEYNKLADRDDGTRESMTKRLGVVKML
jgi:hypothetical protein